MDVGEEAVDMLCFRNFCYTVASDFCDQGMLLAVATMHMYVLYCNLSGNITNECIISVKNELLFVRG